KDRDRIPGPPWTGPGNPGSRLRLHTLGYAWICGGTRGQCRCGRLIHVGCFMSAESCRLPPVRLILPASISSPVDRGVASPCGCMVGHVGGSMSDAACRLQRVGRCLSAVACRLFHVG